MGQVDVTDLREGNLMLTTRPIRIVVKISARLVVDDPIVGILCPSAGHEGIGAQMLLVTNSLEGLLV